MTQFDFQPIGTIHSCFKEKFGIPRQSGLIPDAHATLDILPPYNRPEAFRKLADYSHVWLTFVFHANLKDGWKPMVRPPRLGGNQRVGVFASRSPFRPNPIGLSVVKLDRLEIDKSQIRLHLSGIDLLEAPAPLARLDLVTARGVLLGVDLDGRRDATFEYSLPELPHGAARQIAG